MTKSSKNRIGTPIESNKTIMDIARRVNVQANAENDRFNIDPLTILMIAGLIINLVRLVMQCRGRRSVRSSVTRPGFITKYFIKRAIRKEFPKHECKAIYSGMIEVAKDMSDAEWDEVIDFYEQTEER
jgi:hypothetical protein